jgi:hypothetical protein
MFLSDENPPRQLPNTPSPRDLFRGGSEQPGFRGNDGKIR